MEISPAGACNHRCTYCGLDFMEYKPRFLKTEVLKDRISEMGSLGLKSIMYAGEGEPLLHKDMLDITLHTEKSGIDVAFTTNGVFLDKDFADAALTSITWVKVSINGATKDTYNKIHRGKSDDLDKVMHNMAYANDVRRSNNYKCTLGMQIMLLPDNYQEVGKLAQRAKDIGMDYLVVKPYSHHPQSNTTEYKDIKYDNYLQLKDELSQYNDEQFHVVFRINSMKKWDKGEHGYTHCLALPFWSYIDAGGNVWGCSVYLGDERFLYGNIHEQTFREIWEGEKRRASLEWVKNELDTCNCRVNCRMDEVNKYLWDLKHPSEHVNFI